MIFLVIFAAAVAPWLLILAAVLGSSDLALAGLALALAGGYAGREVERVQRVHP